MQKCRKATEKQHKKQQTHTSDTHQKSTKKSNRTVSESKDSEQMHCQELQIKGFRHMSESSSKSFQANVRVSSSFSANLLLCGFANRCNKTAAPTQSSFQMCSPTKWAAPGIEPGTSHTRSENHAARPSSQ